MGRKKIILIPSAIMALVFVITTISYGYWTDELSISGESTFEYHLAIVKDIEIPEEDPTEIPKDITATDPETAADAGTEQSVTKPQDTAQDTTPEPTTESTPDIILSEDEDSVENENTELQ